ncbi:MAG: 3'-phosphoesterase [Candidatus Altarchaeum sp. CG12_big_fil_rev_8_21_14_0_65_33_22]|uniref:3'-phosphoesterase n=1 Tax=Candidatus Altarchaeum hamiconexum TaxID=1803513 RepID=A0A8J8CEU8_9ARCH|nr:3'-phosphoesterase [Candidatus Altarchaeum hamiconexum]OIQ04634.1 MAG: 3'-phosphoesterase [Candidatus Altarchaeum sp. CG2_30_32_3053]PIN67169.1 MAG: 3'-phosphoesterase [Candidatus Altarchaeum sp. CG12_big_fil_rev_8_21_14_0_65_33_22]PIV28220.1 MAG: 3'-phosphoesterase [Candidatus Altarchaeum sp. CG03_land_8_20_14_0_80_32_618]PIX48656.1 MAG: 3'-phosphoesterase [Candidatus Altarchaeum sp. CG_4_8_14_3_um_filter_33_2054]PIZ30827.1 MAG: 3'-phosphoesterase [Candidatus Altarchaeum sp. CG_4_10_14_0_8
MNSKRFVVQEHWASHYHFDFRLEMDGVLKSCAVPKGVPEKSGVRHLAIAVEDHALDYIDFEGEISEGYGAGTVKIFDKGEYELIKRSEHSLIFELRGKMLKGKYKMMKFKEPDQYLLFMIK